ncbi:MAG: hypothetical protein OSB73_22780, partial [Candidatus Latescibacteria bacterium]|nr:hypothetical protein [Candidatus Latescibacterota bacterium]
RKYFTTGKYDFVLLVLLTLPAATRFVFGDWLPTGVDWSALFACIALLAAIGMVYFRRGFHKLVLGGVAALCAAYICRIPDIALFFSFFIPTLVHVYIFTGAFILFGTLRSRSMSGWLSLAVFVLCGACFFVFDIPNWDYGATEYLRTSMGRLVRIPQEFIRVFGLSPEWDSVVNVMRFIAFAYTYHYLNWFSKTKVIRWHEIPRRRFIALVALYGLSVGVYAINYQWGISALFCLSLIHVFLEFPLNHKTFVGIGNHLRGA